ncbi:MAG: MarR family transcriptional regulator [Chloroflexi bacterium]|nr:MAG: MarR family transcriptional regulator [Chloroflexota bacterium]
MNISPARKESTRSKAGAKRSRDALIADLIGEMTSWSARDRMNAFRSWLKGSLSLIHLHVLSTLEADGPLPMSRLADMLDVSVASATGIVSRMEERNIVERRHTDDDRRVVLVVPTEAGIAVFRTMTEQRRERLAALLGKLSDEELGALQVGLSAIRKAREAMHAEHAATATTAATPAPDASVDRPDAPPEPRA